MLKTLKDKMENFHRKLISTKRINIYKKEEIEITVSKINSTVDKIKGVFGRVEK